MPRPMPAPRQHTDDGLEDYFAACRGQSALSGASCSSSATDSDHEDGSVARAAQATAGDSPLRGRAVQHRHSMQKLRLARTQPQPRFLSAAGESHTFLTEAALAAARTSRARHFADHLSRPLDTARTHPVNAGGVHAYQSPAELQAAQRVKTADAALSFLMDALCAVRQQQTRWFACGMDADGDAGAGRAAARWGFGTADAAQEARQTLSCSVVSVGLQLLKTADLLAGVHEAVSSLARLLETRPPATTTSPDMSSADRGGKGTGAKVALARAAQASLARFLSFLQDSLHRYTAWLMEVGDFLHHLRQDHRKNAATTTASSPPSATLTKARRVGESGTAHSTFESAISVVDAPVVGDGLADDLLGLPLLVEKNAEILVWCLHVCDSLPPHTSAHDAAVVEDVWIECARALVDLLAIRASTAQDASQLSAYRLYVMLLLSCAWPYVPPLLDAMFARLPGVSGTDWARQLPRLFRTSLSPAHGCVDVLSLILDCIDYPGAGGVLSARDGELDVSATTASSCRYVLRSLASFAQQRPRRRQASEVAVMRGPSERTVETILADLVRADLTGTATARTAGALSAEAEAAPITSFLTPQQQRRLSRAWPAAQRTPLRQDSSGDDESMMPVARASSARPVMALATSIPLGVRTMDSELAGLAKWRQSLAGDAAAPHGTNSTSGETGRSAGLVWSLEVVLEGRVGAPDVRLFARDRTGQRDDSAGPAKPRRHKRVLWVDAAIPVTRWVVAALLVPLSLVAQRVQAHRLSSLLAIRPLSSSSPRALRDPAVADMDADDEGGEAPRRRGTADVTRYALRHLTGQLGAQARLVVVPSGFSLYAAVKLLVDVALCRDAERVVRRFLERLAEEPHWWFRRRDAAGAYQARDGTASPLVSSAFADALRDKRFGGLVTLTVLPASESSEETDGGPSLDGTDSAADTPLDIFASFSLHFALPEALAVMLLPRVLSLYMANETGAMQSAYTTAFWQHRQGLDKRASTAEALRLHTTVEQRSDAAAVATTAATTTRTRAIAATSGAFSDVWSYVFGYLCSLQYAQIALRRRQKQVQQQEVQDHQLLASMGRHTAASQRLQRVSRGLGSVFFTLSFAVDTLLTFAQREASIFIHHLEHTLMRGRNGSVGSSMALCQEIDALLLDLFVVCFPSRQPMMHTATERMAISATSEAVREGVSRVLQLALNPTQATPSMMNARVYNAVDALVVMMQSLRDATVLKARLKPLVTLLTFNRFYGVDQGAPSYQFR